MKIRRFARKALAILLLAALTVNPAYAAPAGHTVSIQNQSGKGSVTVSVTAAQKGDVVTGTASPKSGYDLATVRYITTSGGAESYGFAALTKATDGYRFSFTMPDTDVTVAAAFFSETVWDGAVDVSWYDPSAPAYEISKPAQLAGLAALINGMTDKKTPDYMIKGDSALIKTTAYPNILLVGAGGGNVSDTVYASKTDFAYKTVRLTADLDMGGVYDASSKTWSGPNYTPVGGKYSMASDEAAGDSYVIDARFNGVFDGQGHTVKNICCQRYAVKGFPYSMAVGLIGFLGGPSDVPDVVSGTFENGWQPAVRNVIVGAGDIYGRRMVGGVVGRIGETSSGVIVENCANFATVRNTDSKGVGGVVGAAWGPGVIRYCYNMGAISTTFQCPAGGICGSVDGMDVYNCYNTGKIDSNGQQMGRGIGGHEGGRYTVDNCYYLSGCDDDPASNGFYKAANKNISVHVTEMTAAAMQSDAFIGLLNGYGGAFAADKANINGGYPVLYFQTPGYDASKKITVSVKQPASGGTIATDGTGSVNIGKIVALSAKPDAGYKLDYYTVNGTKLAAAFVPATGDMEISASFSKVKAVKITLPDSIDFSVIATKTGYELAGNGLVYVKDKPVYSGDTVLEENVITVKAYGYPDAVPDDAGSEFTDSFTYGATNAQTTADGVFTVDGSADVAVSVVRGTQTKSWVTLADTSWYDRNLVKASYTLTTPEELAGLSALVGSGVTFSNVTVLLGSDISLRNTDGTSGDRQWKAIGSSAFRAFKGTFDGQGHIIRNMDAFSTGSYAGLFGCCTDALIENVTVRGTVGGAASTSYAAGIVASASASIIKNCVNDAPVRIQGSTAGGIAAFISDGTTVTGCVNNADVSAASGVGGIVGICYTPADKITSCMNTGAVASVLGGTDGAGGIAGKLSGAAENCCNSGAVTSADRYTGGLVGYAYTRNSSSVQNSYNTGDVSSTCAKVNAAVGGLIGYAQFVSMSNCYNTGSVTAGSAFATGNIGGVTGRLGTSGDTIANCFYLTGSCGSAVAGGSSSAVSAATPEAMKAADFPGKLNDKAFAAGRYINSGYPVLRWQKDVASYTVSFRGDYSDSVKVLSGGSVELPDAPRGNMYALTVNGNPWDGSNITADVTVAVTKVPVIYTATFTADGAAVGHASFTYGDSAVKEPAVPQKDGYAAFWQPYRLDAHNMTIKAVYRQNTVRGGGRITEDGTYFVQYYSTGAIEIDEGVHAVLNGENGGVDGFDGLTITVGKDASLTLKNLKSTGDTTLLTMKGGNTLTLSGSSALIGTCDEKGNLTQTVRLEGDATVVGSGTLMIQSGIGNAAVYIAPKATFVQESGTLLVKKNNLLGSAGGAVFAPDADLVFSGGTFSGCTDSDNVSVLSAKSVTVTGGSVTAVAEKSPVTIDSKDIRITGGSVKAVGHSGNSMTIDRYYYNEASLPGYTGGLAAAVLGTGWSELPSAVTVDGKSISIGAGHIGLTGEPAGAGAADGLLYLWLTKADHTVTADGRNLTLKWDAAASTFRLSGPSDIFILTLGGDSLQAASDKTISAGRQVFVSAYDPAGKMLAGCTAQETAVTLPIPGACFRPMVLETDAHGGPLTDYAYLVRFTH